VWAITSYFNPVGFKTRLPNYRIFRENLAVPIVTVELSFDGRFELNEKDADILIQISGGAVLWQKERLLNLAVRSVPRDVDNIAWIDGDLIFEKRDWLVEAEKQLENFNIVQLFSDQVDLGPDDDQRNFNDRRMPPSAHGVVSLIHAGKFKQPDPNTTSPQYRRSLAWGMAWAAKRKIIQDHGIYDAMIAGGGTRALVCAIYGFFDEAIEALRLSGAQKDHYLAWARPYHDAVGKTAGYVPGRIYHLWHGSIENRNYASRYQGLVDTNFQPDNDLVIGSNGAWRWARQNPALETFLMNHFIGRAEDG
jgi:hypothetical protein